MYVCCRTGLGFHPKGMLGRTWGFIEYVVAGMVMTEAEVDTDASLWNVMDVQVQL
jgi:hypothetical protein